VLCSVRTTRMEGMNAKNFDEVFATLIAQGISPDELFDSVCKQVMSAQSCQNRLLFPLAKVCVQRCTVHHKMCFSLQRVEIVLTAHPTQVNRRTLQYKHTRIATLLAQNDRHVSCSLNCKQCQDQDTLCI